VTILFFDLDGPILDVSEKYYRAYADSLNELGKKALEKAQYWSLKRKQISDYEILSLSSCGELLSDFRAKRDQLIEDKKLLKLDRVWPELRGTYETLFTQLLVVLVTLRTYAKRTIWQLEMLGIRPWFDFILSHSAEHSSIQRWKVKVDMINQLNLFNKVEPRNCVFVGDTETDILAGKHLGMQTVAVSFGIRTKESLLSHNPDLLFDSQAALSTYLTEVYL
jgi:phosphoglycolate phosphatase